MLVELTKVEMVDGSPTINRIYVNPQHVVSVTEDNLAYHELKEGLLQAGVHNQFSVSKVVLYDGGTSSKVIIIMGDPRRIQEKLGGKKQVLRG
tara:strand:- start:725 stop:1003 length:279 start_codon:yes stop_codon:yes gene_type:complete